MTVGQRIRVVIKAQNKSVKMFSNDTGIPLGTLNGIIGSKQTVPSFTVLEAILQNTKNLSPAWLMLEEGQMWIDESEKVLRQENDTERELTILQGKLSELEKLLANSGGSANSKNVVEISKEVKDIRRMFEMMIGRTAEIEMSFENFEEYKENTDKELSKLRYLVRKLKEEQDKYA